MARVYVSAAMNATIDQAWSFLRDFGALGNYHPYFEKSYIEDGKPSDQVGCVRNFFTHEGGHIREELLTLSDREHVCAYRILEATLPVQNYVAEMRLKPVTEGNKCFGEWWADYDVAAADAESVHQTVSDTFRFAFEGAVKVANSRRKA